MLRVIVRDRDRDRVRVGLRGGVGRQFKQFPADFARIVQEQRYSVEDSHFDGVFEAHGQTTTLEVNMQSPME